MTFVDWFRKRFHRLLIRIRQQFIDPCHPRMVLRELLAQNHAWMARVYELLADSYEKSMEPFAEPVDEGHLDEIGQSFARLLLAGLPPGQSDLINHPSFAA